MSATPPQDVGEWLSAIGLARYADLFREHAIDLEVLSELTNDDLKDIAIPLGDRKRLLKAIAERTDVVPDQPLATTRVLGEPGRAERRQVTIMFCDLVGSTELANEFDPEDLGSLLRDYRTCVTEAAVRWHGNIARYYGDGALLYFGWPQAREDDAERAVHAGLELVASVGRLTIGTVPRAVSARVGIATGDVMIGELIGDGFATEESVVGPIPNLAARLQAVAEPGAVIIADSTYALVGGLFDCISGGLRRLKGFPDELAVWQVRSASEITRFETRLSRLTPFVGRPQEVRILQELWEQSATGRGQSAVLIGEAGIGKSRLVQTFRDMAGPGTYADLHWQCSPFHTNSALHPVIQSLRRFAGISPDDAPGVQQTKIIQLVTTGDFGFDPGAAAVRALFARGEDKAVLGAAPEVRLQDVMDVAVHFALGMAASRPLLLVVEDIHWADPSTVTVINQLLAALHSRPLLLLITARPTSNLDHVQADSIVRITLDRLANDAARSMISRMTDGKALPTAVLEAIIATTDGIPLFVEELTKTVMQSGQLLEIGDRYELRGSMLDLAIPATLRDSLAARLDGLASGKHVAQVAATIGRAFSPDLLQQVMQTPQNELATELSRLCDAGILHEQEAATGRRYVFKHALIQEAAYQSQLKTRRREIHARLGRVLEENFPREAQSAPDMLAHHFAEAGMPEDAARYTLSASRNALRLGATDETIASLNKGLRLIAPLPASPSRNLLELRLHASLGAALMMSKSWAAPEAEAAYTAASALSSAATDPIEAIWILWSVFVFNQVRGNLKQAETACERICEAAERHGDRSSRLIASMVSVQTAFYTGRFDEAAGHCAAVTRNFSPQNDRSLIMFYTIDLELVSIVHNALASWLVGRSGEALALAMRAERLAREIDHSYSMAWVLTWGSMVYLLHNDLRALQIRLEEGIGIADQHGFAYIGALGRMMRGWHRGRSGGLADGIAEMRDGLEAFRATGAGIVLPYFRTLLAELLAADGRSTEALELIEEAETQIERFGESWALAEVYRVRGDIFVKHRTTAAAAQCYEQALAVAGRQNASGWQSPAHRSLTNMLAVGEDVQGRSLFGDDIPAPGGTFEGAKHV